MIIYNIDKNLSFINNFNYEFFKSNSTVLINKIKELSYLLTKQNVIVTGLLLATPIITIGLPHFIIRF